MNRRDALSRVALLIGGSVVGAEIFLNGCNTATETKAGASLNFSKDDIAYLDEIAETILPATNTPGAKEAKVGDFMTVYASKKKNSKSFMESTPQQRHDLLVDIDKEAKDYQKVKKDGDPNHYFSLMKQLTLMGYFTSEPGATKALRYVAIPGRYEGCIPYKKGDKAWAT